MAAMSLVSALKVGSTILGVVGQLQQGKAAQQQADYQAAQLEQKAGQERAVSQREAEKMRRRAKFAESRALALAAASGGGASDPTVTNLMAGISGEGELAAQTAIYEGEERARGSEMGAEAKRFEGKSARQASKIGAFSTILGGAAKLGKGLTEKYAPSPAPSYAAEATPSWTWDY